MKMGRIGDGDVHAAYVEFRAKESDKVNSLSSFISEFLKHATHFISSASSSPISSSIFFYFFFPRQKIYQKNTISLAHETVQ